MTDDLLPYYHRELAFIRKMGGAFADAHPQVASRLRLGPDECQDPHVERMIEAFAFLTARVRHKLDDDFPELTEALLSVLYPHYQAPVPSMAIAQFHLDRGQADLVAGYPIDAGTPLETDPVDGEPCRFRTAYPVKLFPFEVASASLQGLPPSGPGGASRVPGAVAALRLRLQGFSPELKFAALQTPSLRFFLKGQDQHVFALYELLMNNVVEVAVSSADGKRHVSLGGPAAVQPVGFGRDEGLLPYTARSFLGYRLLTEYFTFPRKFLFLDVAGLTPERLAGFQGAVDLTFYLTKSSPDLEQNVSADTFRTGCTPVVNLYTRRAEPIQLTHTETEYRVVPDARAPLANEVYSVDRVTATSPDGEVVEYLPFYSLKHSAPAAAGPGRRQAFWYASRRPSHGAANRGDAGTEVFLSVVNLDFDPASAAANDWTLDVETTCLSRDLPARLGTPRLHPATGGPVRVDCITPPTKTFRPPTRNGLMWRLISHLSLNHLSITGGADGAEALREILRLYDMAETADTRAKIDSVLSVESRRVVGRAPGPGMGFCRGVEVHVHFDEAKFSDKGVFLFASVLERFLGLYSSINSFAQMLATTKQREGTLRRWAPRAAEKALL